MRSATKIGLVAAVILPLLSACDRQAQGAAAPQGIQALFGPPTAVPARSPTPPPTPMPQELSEADQAELLSDIAGVALYTKVLDAKDETGQVVAPGREKDLQQAERDLAAIKQQLAGLSTSGPPTFALIHSLRPDGSLKAWLIGPDGGIVSGATGKYAGLASMVDGLGVTALVVNRGPRPEGSPPVSADAERAARARDRSPQSLAKRQATLEQTAATLLPGPVGAALGTRQGRLLVVAARDTGTAPYAALPLENGLAARNWSFVVLSDIGTLARGEGTFDFAALDFDKAVVVGDPDLSRDPLADWVPLPGARREAEAVAARLTDPSTRLLIGKAATAKNVLGAIDANPQAGIVYMATHAVADPARPLTRGYVALTDGYLYAGNIRQLRPKGWNEHHPLVVMSACQTALGRYLDGGGFGVARTWTKIGAGQVVASLWNVSDNATETLMLHFVDGIKRGLPPELAMQQAQIATMEYRNAQGVQPYRDDPKMWASFTVYGKPSGPAAR